MVEFSFHSTHVKWGKMSLIDANFCPPCARHVHTRGENWSKLKTFCVHPMQGMYIQGEKVLLIFFPLRISVRNISFSHGHYNGFHTFARARAHARTHTHTCDVLGYWHLGISHFPFTRAWLQDDVPTLLSPQVYTHTHTHTQVVYICIK